MSHKAKTKEGQRKARKARREKRRWRKLDASALEELQRKEIASMPLHQRPVLNLLDS